MAGNKTCAECSELYLAPRCNRTGSIVRDTDDYPDDDGCTWADHCIYWKKRDEPTLEERCRQLEQLAREMYEWCTGVTRRNWTVVPERVDAFREKLEGLGVSLDG